MGASGEIVMGFLVIPCTIGVFSKISLYSSCVIRASIEGASRETSRSLMIPTTFPSAESTGTWRLPEWRIIKAASRRRASSRSELTFRVM